MLLLNATNEFAVQLKDSDTIKAHSHQARLRPSTDVDALGVNAQAFSHVFHIGVDGRRRT